MSKYVSAGRSRPYGKLDPTLLSRFTQIPEFLVSLTSEQRVDVSKRLTDSGLSLEEKLVYEAVKDGFSDLDCLPVATGGLTVTSIKTALGSLTSKGYIKEILDETIPTEV